MFLKEEVASQLQIIHFHRNKNLWVFHALLMLISILAQKEKFFLTSWGSYSIALMFLGIILRLIFFRVVYQKWKEGGGWVNWFNYFGQFILACAWMVHFWVIFNAYGPNTYNTSNTLILIAGIITGASTSSVGHKSTYHILSGSLCLFLAIIYTMHPGADDTVVLYILVFYIFNSYNINLGHRQLIRSIHNEIKSRIEKERVTKIIDTVPGFVAVFDKNLVCTLANKAVLSYFPDIVGNKIGDFDHEGNWENYLADFIASEKILSVDEANYSRDNRDVWMLRNAQRSSDGGVVFVSMDISELVLAKNKIREQEAVSQYTAKLASLGEMAAGIAHEINNPLTIIQGSASVISKLVDQDPMDKATIQLLTNKLNQTSERISKIIRSLKNLSRSGEHDPYDDLDLQKILEQCLDLLRSRFDRQKVELRLPQFDRPVTFRGQEVQISQVLMNLIGNALDAVKEDENAWIEVRYKLNKKSIDIFVTDSGPGIPENIRNKIMEPFFTTKEVNQGTGLGLSISKNIMVSHGGELTLLHETHTTFKMHLPLDI